MSTTDHEPLAGGAPAPNRPERRADAASPPPAWPLVERRHMPRGFRYGGPERRRSDAGRPSPVPTVPPMEPFRWAAIGIGLIVGMSRLSLTSYRLWFVLAALIAYAAYRTARPIPYDQSRWSSVAIVTEMAFHTAAVVASGSWWSPYAFSLLPTALLAGFSRGRRFALWLTFAASVAISLRHIVVAATLVQGGKDAGVWVGLLVLVAVSSGWARQVSHESARQQSLALDRLGQLTEANALLSSLHRVAQTLPASLDLDDVLSSTMVRLRDLIGYGSCAIVLYEESDQSWTTARQSGEAVASLLTTAQLPAPVLRALSMRGALLEAEMPAGAGLARTARCGLYAALYARGARIGVLAVEADEPRRYARIDQELLNGLVEPFGVAIDNARMFARLRTIGADEERSRIARDLHDRIGQSLAHLGFELDRAVRAADRGAEVGPLLEELRRHVRGTVRQVRETLYDLRTDVSETQDMGDTMEMFVGRVRDRSGMEVDLIRQDAGNRLPLLQERELWRIAKEAVINAERHAKAQSLRITWRCDAGSAELRVSDDGTGFQPGAARRDSYGLLGMKERATSIGASLDIDSSAGVGTTVRVRIGAPR